MSDEQMISIVVKQLTNDDLIECLEVAAPFLSLQHLPSISGLMLEAANRLAEQTDYEAIIKQCFGEIEAKRKFAIDQRQQCDDWEYEYYDGMVDAYARAMAILEEHMKKDGEV